MSVIHTERLVLRPFKKDDETAMFKNWTFDNRVAKYCRWTPHKSVQETKELLKIYLDKSKNNYKYRFAITLKEFDEPIGCIDAVDISEDNKTATIGYVLSYDYWNKGIVTESLKAVIEFLFNNGFERVIAEHRVENLASGRVMQKSGVIFTHFGKALVKFGSDELCDTAWYEIKK